MGPLTVLDIKEYNIILFVDIFSAPSGGGSTSSTTSATPGGTPGTPSTAAAASAAAAANFNNSQQGFMQRLVTDKSSAFRSHPLFPLLRDLIIADMNFHEPSFPHSLIRDLPSDFNKLLTVCTRAWSINQI